MITLLNIRILDHLSILCCDTLCCVYIDCKVLFCPIKMFCDNNGIFSEETDFLKRYSQRDCRLPCDQKHSRVVAQL